MVGKRIPKFTARKIWFLGKDLVSIHHTSRAAGVVTLQNWTQDRLVTMTQKDFKNYRRRAYSVFEVARLMNRNTDYFSRKVHDGTLPEPMGREPGGRQKFRGPGYYTEAQVYQIRDLFAQTHYGRPRKDGLITNKTTPTESELRAKLTGNFLVYVENEDGEFIPVFDNFGNDLTGN